MAVNDHSYIIIGGSTKCATTSLFAYLAAHPQVSSSQIKESRFFWEGDYNLKKEGVNLSDGIDNYDSIFKDKEGALYRLEATPDYLYSSKSADLIRDNLKEVRLIFIFRDRIQRIVSWFKFSKQLNLINAQTSIDEYILTQLKSAANNPSQHMRAVEQGRYATYLKKYIDVFGKEKIKIIRYEDISLNPQAVLVDIANYLNIDGAFYKSYNFKILNQSVNVKDVEKFNKYRTIRRNFRRTAKNILPEFLKRPLARVFKTVDNTYINKTSKDWEEIKISPSVMNQLITYYRDDEDQLMLLQGM